MVTIPLSPPPETLMDTLFSYDNTIMLAAIISLLLVILFVLLLHLYARWFLSRHNNQSLHQLSTITTHEISLPAKEIASLGLDPSAISSIPTFSYHASGPTSVIECSVCLSEFGEGEVGRSLPRCAHRFHVECIDTWLRDHTTCPVCRLVVVVVVVHCRDDVVLVSRSCRSDVVVSVANHPPERPRISV